MGRKDTFGIESIYLDDMIRGIYKWLKKNTYLSSVSAFLISALSTLFHILNFSALRSLHSALSGPEGHAGRLNLSDLALPTLYTLINGVLLKMLSQIKTKTLT